MSGTILDRLVEARAALLELAPLVHSERPEHLDCGTWRTCEPYHDAMAAVVEAAEGLGFSRSSLDRQAVERIADRIDERTAW
jgi:hypothetical protein